MAWRIPVMMGTTAVLSTVGLVPVETWAEQLGKGSAQIVLSVVLLGLAWAYHKKDVRHQMDWEQFMKAQAALGGVTRDTLKESTAAGQRQADAVERLDATIHDLTKAIEKCDKRG